MAAKILFYLTANRLSAYEWHGGTLREIHSFDDVAEGHDRFFDYLHAQHRNPVRVLTDLVEEEHRIEVVPHLIGPERRSLFNRKLEQFFRGSPYRAAQPLERLAEGRRDDRVLFSSLTNAAAINPWVERLLAQRFPIAGIYSVPFVSHRIVAGLKVSHLLMVSWDRRAGLRQTFFLNGQFHFSRLTPFGTAESLSDKLSAETGRTVQYLRSLSLLPQDRPLDVLILAGDAEATRLRGELVTLPGVRFQFRDIAAAATDLGLRSEVHSSEATPLYLHLLARSAMANQYAGSNHLHYYRLWQVRAGIWWAAAGLAAAGMLFSGLNLWQAAELRGVSDSLRADVEALSGAYKAVSASLPRAVVSTEAMKSAVAAAEVLVNRSPSPGRLLRDVSAAIGQFPSLQVDSLSWQFTANPDAAMPDLDARTALSIDRSAPQPPSRERNPAVPAEFEVLFLGGEVKGGSGDLRQALETVESLQRALIGMGFEVTPITMPVDLRPQSSLSSEAREVRGERPPAFLLKLSRKVAA